MKNLLLKSSSSSSRERKSRAWRNVHDYDIKSISGATEINLDVSWKMFKERILVIVERRVRTERELAERIRKSTLIHLSSYI